MREWLLAVTQSCDGVDKPLMKSSTNPFNPTKDLKYTNWLAIDTIQDISTTPYHRTKLRSCFP